MCNRELESKTQVNPWLHMASSDKSFLLKEKEIMCYDVRKEILTAGGCELQSTEADIIKSFIVQNHALISILH